VNNVANNISKEEAQQGWKLLWDGLTSHGWRSVNKSSFPEKVWQIENGVLTVKGTTGAEAAAGGDIVTDAEFSAFDLQFEFRITDTANSGVKYFVTEK
jgi:hypothetical protein